MAQFHISREVGLPQPNSWTICFQYGEYEYDPDQDTEHPSEWGYRFIWRKPNGALQGARGQARLMPEWITILLGMAAKEGWYPTLSGVDQTVENLMNALGKMGLWKRLNNVQDFHAHVLERFSTFDVGAKKRQLEHSKQAVRFAEDGKIGSVIQCIKNIQHEASTGPRV